MKVVLDQMQLLWNGETELGPSKKSELWNAALLGISDDNSCLTVQEGSCNLLCHFKVLRIDAF